jgi:hypothetical protein
LIATTHVAERLLGEHDENIKLEVPDDHYESALEHLGISIEELDEIRETLADEGAHV